MVEISSIRSVIDLWPARRALAEDVGVSESRVHNWAKSGTIPARYHARIVRAAMGRGLEVDAALLVRLHDLDGVVPPPPLAEAAE